VQYHLLSLRPAEQFDKNSCQHYAVYETCRLAGLVFGIGVTFPLPAERAPFQTLIIRMQAALHVSYLESTWSSEDAVRVLLWVLVIGGIAARDLPERAWFVATLRRITLCSGLSTWQDLKQALKLMLWLDSACDSAGMKLWEDLTGSF
jgi:hypothetical protein